MSEQAKAEVTFSSDYRDACGNYHARFSVVDQRGKRFHGEAVYDPTYERTILDDDVLQLKRDIVVEIKRGMREYIASLTKDGLAPQKAPEETPKEA